MLGEFVDDEFGDPGVIGEGGDAAGGEHLVGGALVLEHLARPLGGGGRRGQQTQPLDVGRQRAHHAAPQRHRRAHGRTQVARAVYFGRPGNPDGARVWLRHLLLEI